LFAPKIFTWVLRTNNHSLIYNQYQYPNLIHECSRKWVVFFFHLKIPKFSQQHTLKSQLVSQTLKRESKNSISTHIKIPTNFSHSWQKLLKKKHSLTNQFLQKFKFQLIVYLMNFKENQTQNTKHPQNYPQTIFSHYTSFYWTETCLASTILWMEEGHFSNQILSKELFKAFPLRMTNFRNLHAPHLVFYIFN